VVFDVYYSLVVRKEVSALKTLAFENFSDLSVKPFPADYTALGEYHYKPPEGNRGRWYESTNRRGWLVIEDDGRHRMIQTGDGDKELVRILVTGDPLWTDYTLKARLQPLRDDGFVGIVFRYETSRTNYRFGFDSGKYLRLIKDYHRTHDTLAEMRFEYSCERIYELEVRIEGDHILAYVDGELKFELHDGNYPRGRVGIAAQVPAAFDELQVTAEDPIYTAFIQTRDREQRELDELREQYPKPVLWKQIDTKGFGVGRHIRFGHLTGKDRLDVVLAQNIKLQPERDNLTTTRCLTALDLDGNVLWQFGEPSSDPDAGLATCDVPVQIYDIDGDGKDEVLCIKNFKLYVLNGQDGTVESVMPLPMNPEDENRYGRLTGDSIIIANFRGEPRPSDIVIKNRYKQVWAYDNQFNLLWTHRCRNTGHFAVPYDFDSDGRDDLFIGYTLIGPDGDVKWSKDWGDHTDEIAIGPFDPNREDVQIALVCGEEGFNILSPDGEVLHRDFLGHAQRLSAAKFRADLDGLQFYVITFWGNPGIISFHDCRGKKLFNFEPTTTGNVLNPVNWTGNGTELALLSGSRKHGGMLDGYGHTAVVFPDDGHPEMCAEALDLTGDARDEIVLWDLERMWIYTQAEHFRGDRIYKPIRYPHYNASDYRAEISLPAPIS
jgi:rhamnogalacturonan endolyase